mgnify:CR=1 FL=1
MAKSSAVWGIDIGQCALKALRCQRHEDVGLISAESFDYIEYSKILSQPDASPAELIHEALEQVLDLLRAELPGVSVVIFQEVWRDARGAGALVASGVSNRGVLQLGDDAKVSGDHLVDIGFCMV